MVRIEQRPAERGSQRWLQLLVSRAPHLFAEQLLAKLHPPSQDSIEWLSPIPSDDLAEYRDAAFLKRIEVALPRRSLSSFWPRWGPVWDGLARTSRGDVLLVEAKANIPELASPATKAGAVPARLIESSLTEAKPAFGAPAEARWSSTYYQYANRLAHLYLLRSLNQVAAYLVFLYFINAHDVSGPRSEEEWRPEIHRVHAALQLGNGPLSPFVLSVFVDSGRVRGAA